MKKLIAMLLALIMVLSLAACGAKDETPAPSSDAGADAGEAAGSDSAGEDEAAKTRQWGFIFEQLTNPNYVTMSGVALDYCKELGIELQIVDGQENSDTMVNAAENMATMGYEVILLSPMNVELVSTIALAAKAINPDVIVVNSANAVPECDYSLLQDDYTSGVVSGEHAAQWALDHGQTQIFLIGYPRDQALIDRENGFREGVANVSADIEIIYSDFSNFTDFTAASENLMTAYPDCHNAYGISDIIMSYFYEALQASGQDTADWAVWAVDGTLDGVSWIYEGKGFRGTADTGTLEIPTAMVDSALALCDGTAAEDIAVELPVVMITADNVDAYAEKIGYEG